MPSISSAPPLGRRIYVSGSMAYDRIMDFPGKFADHIMPDKIHILNVSFNVNGLVERMGGTAGNIAYALALLGEQPRILATIGHDYQRYFAWLQKNGISREGLRVIKEEFTAGAYITTDAADNQITGFNPGAMKHPCRYDISKADPRRSIGIIGAGNLDDMMTLPKAYKAKGIPYLFDPAQSLPIWDGRALAEALTGAKVLISNDYELGLIMKMTKLTKEQIVRRVGAVVTTKAEQGSVVTTKDGERHVAAVKLAKKPVDPTGAGDAYRGGFLKGLVTGKSFEESARLGSVIASYAVEVYGTQSYSFTKRDFEARYKRTFG
ncbi:MAG: carbohydrate kinase family protein [Chloroflexi bacterium]|nr:carbohydrate kinase family protein [Chloroflexota bacterium]